MYVCVYVCTTAGSVSNLYVCMYVYTYVLLQVVLVISERASETSELSHCSGQSRFEICTYICVAVRQPLCACPRKYC